MKPNIIVTTTFIMLSFMLFACNKKIRTDVKANQFWECNSSQNFDSTKLANTLLGDWKWISSQSEIGGTIKADKNVIVTFSSNGRFSISENSSIITSGNWKLKIIDASIYGLALDQATNYLHGRILQCENQVLFNNSYIDGTDNLFERN